MAAGRTARDRARAELTLEIKDAARRQLAVEGADRLSLRAVARELGMVPSALYRYFPSRDELLTALIIEAYDALGDAVERAVAARPAGAGAPAAPELAGRWRAGCRAVRSWAVARPSEFALLYGSPVPGYRAPPDTVAPATRVYVALLGVVRDAARAGVLRSPPGPALPSPLAGDAERIATTLAVPGVAPDVLARAVTAWTQVIGAVSLELFGHLADGFTDDGAFFDHTVALMAGLVGFGPAEAAGA